jgi:hypothetical protein
MAASAVHGYGFPTSLGRAKRRDSLATTVFLPFPFARAMLCSAPMKSTSKSLRAIGMAALLTCTALAEEAVTLSPMLSFGPFPLNVTRTSVLAHPGLPAGKAELDTPFPDDFPPHVVVTIEDKREFPALKKGPRYFSPARNTITAYRITDVEKAPHKTIKTDITLLKKLLAEKPKTVPHKDMGRELPDYPPRNAAHAFELRLTYVDAEWGSGLYYLTQFTQETGGFANNEQLVCVFQGLSKDGAFYVSADLRVTHPSLPAGIDAKPKREDDQYAADSAMLSKAKDDSFTPSLGKIREWLGTVQLK